MAIIRQNVNSTNIVDGSVSSADLASTLDLSGKTVTYGNLPAANLTGTLPAIDGSALTGIESLPTAISVNGSAPDNSLNINSSGNVGIGTSSPHTELNVQGGIGAASATETTTKSNALFSLSSAATGTKLYQGIESGNLVWLQAQNSDNSLKSIALNPVGGNVGIGTTSPNAKTEIVGRLTLTDGGGASRYALNLESNNSGIGYTSINAYNYATSSGTNLILNESGGNVGIGLTSPTSRLTVRTADGDGISIQNAAGTAYRWAVNADNSFSCVNTGIAERMRIASNGQLLYGFTSSQSGGQWQHYTPANNYNIQFFTEYASGTGYFLEFIRSVSGSYNAVGTITASTTTTSYGTSSDYRLKDNVVLMSNSIDRLKQLKPSTWSWVQDGSHGEGFLAHEAQTVVPEAVTGTKDEVDDEGNPKYQNIDQSKLVPLLTAALQEAITKIEDLETRIQALENA